VHHKGKNCDPAAKVKQIETLLSQNKQYLYPTTLSISGYPRAPTRMPKPNGGWGDLRDHQLCLSFLQPDAHR
jgi:alpha-1,6-mannosyl-glycoprotein beta-1,2-N-acetylglucosaminyltransferase